MRLPWTSGPASEPVTVAPAVIPSLGNGIAEPLTADSIRDLLETLGSNELPDAGGDFHVDWAGVRTRVAMLPWAPQDAADNGVNADLITGSPDEIVTALATPPGEVEMRVVRAAGWHSTTVLRSPDINENEMCAAVWMLPGTDVDYREAHLTHHDVPAVSMAALLGSDVLTDLLHVDVQGVQFDLLEPASDVVQQNVRLMAIGTTSRLVEGQLQQYFLARGWGLLVDAPIH